MRDELIIIWFVISIERYEQYIAIRAENLYSTFTLSHNNSEEEKNIIR